MHTCIFYHVDFNLERPTAFHINQQTSNEHIHCSISSWVIQFTLKISVSDLESPIQGKFPNYFQTTETGAARASTDKPSFSCETRLEQTCTLFNLRLQYISSGVSRVQAI